MVDRERIEAAVRELLAAVGDDPGRPELAETPARVAEAYGEFFAGVGTDPTALLTTGTLPAPSGETVIVRDLTFRSMCEHHLLPFRGVAHIAYAPGESIVGFGRLPRVIDALAARPQLQERLTEQIADTLVAGLAPRGVLVVIQAAHGCLRDRGPAQHESTSVTLASRGILAEPAARAEAIELIALTSRPEHAPADRSRAADDRAEHEREGSDL